tara:strand:- start:1043 stop:1291 length:249 start_codon:yes stop_codon:yes gene_type:complete
MAGNTFGKIFTLTTFGESHGTALGCILDGCPPGLEISESDIQKELDKESLDLPSTRLKEKRKIKLRYFLEFLKEKPQELLLV